MEMNNDGIIFRFLEYDFTSEDEFENAKFITGLTVKKPFDDFMNFIKSIQGFDIELKERSYTIDKIIPSFGGEEGDAFCVNIYCY